jgi:putative redox protein
MPGLLIFTAINIIDLKTKPIMTQIIAKIGKEKYVTSLTNGRHQVIADEPKPIGQDSGPTPYDLLLMALGSCVAMTLRMYADRKGWDLDEVQVNLNQNRIHARDCDECESKDGFIQVIEKEVKLVGNLDDKQRARLIEISDKCPVNRTLLNEIKIETKELA